MASVFAKVNEVSAVSAFWDRYMWQQLPADSRQPIAIVCFQGGKKSRSSVYAPQDSNYSFLHPLEALFQICLKPWKREGGPDHTGCTAFACVSSSSSVQRDLSPCAHWLVLHWTAESALVTQCLPWVLLCFRSDLRVHGLLDLQPMPSLLKETGWDWCHMEDSRNGERSQLGSQSF